MLPSLPLVHLIYSTNNSVLRRVKLISWDVERRLNTDWRHWYLLGGSSHCRIWASSIKSSTTSSWTKMSTVISYAFWRHKLCLNISIEFLVINIARMFSRFIYVPDNFEIMIFHIWNSNEIINQMIEIFKAHLPSSFAVYFIKVLLKIQIF